MTQQKDAAYWHSSTSQGPSRRKSRRRKTTTSTRVTLSTCEAEFISLAEGAKSTIFPMQLLLEMNVDTRPFTLKEDNEACIKLVRQNVDFKRSKHILNRFYYLRHIAATMAKVQHVRSEEQLADILTKSTFTKSYFDEMARKLLKYTD